MSAVVYGEAVEINGRKVESEEFVQTRRVKKNPEEWQKKQKTRRPSQKGDIPTPDFSLVIVPGEKQTQVIPKSEPVQAPVATLLVVSMEEKTEIVEEKMKAIVAPVSGERKILLPVPGFRICPRCGCYSVHIVINGEPHLACIGCEDAYQAYRKKCHNEYLAYMNRLAAEFDAGGDPDIKDEVVLFKPEWLLTQLDIASLDKELDDARLMMDIHNKRCQRRYERVSEKVQAKTAGKTLPSAVEISLRKKYEKELVEEDAQNAKNDQERVRYLNGWLNAAKDLKTKMEKRIAERTVNAIATASETNIPGQNTAVLVVSESATS